MADINRGTLPASIAQDIWAKTIEDSAVMKLARRVTLPGNGTAIPVITGEPAADWVAETAAKPVSNSTFQMKTLQPYKLAVIETVSMELTRDLPALYDALRARLPYALAAKFDATVMGGTAPGTNFDVLTAATTVNLTTAATPYAGLVTADAAISANGGVTDGIVLAPQGKSFLLAATDGNHRPLFTESVANGNIAQILGAPVEVRKAAYVQGTPSQVGYMGDWTQALWGMVDDIQISIADQATLTTGSTTINLWQQNMIGIRAEVEVAFAADVDCFAKLAITE